MSENCEYCNKKLNTDGFCDDGCFFGKVGMPTINQDIVRCKKCGEVNFSSRNFELCMKCDNIIETIISLDQALQNSGGAVQTLTRLKNMTAYDLICLIAPNKIRFKYE